MILLLREQDSQHFPEISGSWILLPFTILFPIGANAAGFGLLLENKRNGMKYQNLKCFLNKEKHY